MRPMKTITLSVLTVSLATTLSFASAMAEPPANGPRSFMDFFDGDRLVNPWLKNSSGQFSIQISTTFSTQEAGESAVQTIAVPTYTEIFRSQLRNNQPVPSISTLEARYSRYLKHYPQLSLQQRAEALARYISREYRVTVPSESILSALTVEQIKAHPSKIASITSQVKNHLSLGQKIHIASHFGGLFARDYNYDRLGSNNPSGYKSLEELVVALSTSENGGVCRDISLAQGQLLKQLGVPSQNIYTMAYQTPTAHHAVLVVQNPESDQIIKINYSSVSTSEKAGSAGLHIGGKHQAAGIEYRFYDVNGKPVQAQNTALGRLLKDLTGSTPVFADSLAPYNVSKVIMSTRWGEAAVFTGNLIDSNDKVTGVAFNSIDLSNVLGPNTEVGVAFIDRNSSGKDFSFNQQGFFVNLRTMREKQFALGPVMTTAQFGAEAQFAALYTTTHRNGESQSRTNTEYRANVFTALNFDYKNYNAGILAVGYADFNHVAKGPSGGYTLAVNHIRLNAGTSRIINNDVLLTGQAFLTIRDVGNTLNFESAVSKNNRSLSFNYQKPLDDIPLMFDGSTEVMRFRGQSVKSTGERKSQVRHFDVRYDKDQKEAQASLGLSWRW